MTESDLLHNVHLCHIPWHGHYNGDTGSKPIDTLNALQPYAVGMGIPMETNYIAFCCQKGWIGILGAVMLSLLEMNTEKYGLILSIFISIFLIIYWRNLKPFNEFSQPLKLQLSTKRNILLL